VGTWWREEKYEFAQRFTLTFKKHIASKHFLKIKNPSEKVASRNGITKTQNETFVGVNTSLFLLNMTLLQAVSEL